MGTAIECPPCKLLLCSGGEVMGAARYVDATANALMSIVLQRSIMGQPITEAERTEATTLLMAQGETLKKVNAEIEGLAKKLGGLY